MSGEIILTQADGLLDGRIKYGDGTNQFITNRLYYHWVNLNYHIYMKRTNSFILFGRAFKDAKNDF